MPSSRSTLFSTAARRARVSRLPSPASIRSRVLSVSSKVIFPELPDASMDTRKPIAFPQYSYNKFSESSHRAPSPPMQKRDISTCVDTQQTTLSFLREKENGRDDESSPRPFRINAFDPRRSNRRLGRFYSAAEVQRKPNETVGL